MEFKNCITDRYQVRGKVYERRRKRIRNGVTIPKIDRVLVAGKVELSWFHTWIRGIKINPLLIAMFDGCDDT